MGMAAGLKSGLRSGINITPYIDILLVLLIIFMVVAPIHQTDLRVKVPQAPTAPAIESRRDIIVLSIGESARIAINQIPTDIEALGSRLQEIYSKRVNKDMFLSASPSLPFGDIVKIIDISKGAGVGDIGLMTEDLR